MGWPTIPPIIFTDSVKARTVTWEGKDAAGGRMPTVGDWGPEVECSVSAAGANDVAIHSRESMVVTHVVTCLDRLGSLRDQLQWKETGAVFTIIGVVPAGDGTGRIWEHMVEERPLR